MILNFKFQISNLFLCLLCLFAVIFSAQQPKLVPHKITLKSGKSFNLNAPASYEIIPAVEGLKRVRFLAKAPDGRFFVTNMQDLTDTNLILFSNQIRVSNWRQFQYATRINFL